MKMHILTTDLVSNLSWLFWALYKSQPEHQYLKDARIVHWLRLNKRGPIKKMLHRRVKGEQKLGVGMSRDGLSWEPQVAAEAQRPTRKWWHASHVLMGEHRGPWGNGGLPPRTPKWEPREPMQPEILLGWACCWWEHVAEDIGGGQLPSKGPGKSTGEPAYPEALTQQASNSKPVGRQMESVRGTEEGTLEGKGTGEE